MGSRLDELVSRSELIDLEHIAETSRSQYASGMRVYEAVMLAIGEEAYPITERKIRGLMIFKEDEKREYHTLRGYLCALVDYFGTNLLPDLTKSLTFKHFKNGLRRKLLGDKQPAHRKEPLVAEDLQKFLGVLGTSRWENQEFLLLCSLLYYGFLRIGEALSLCWTDISLTEESMTLHIRKSKTDQTGYGQDVKIIAMPGAVRPQRFYFFPPATNPDHLVFSRSENTYRGVLARTLAVLRYTEGIYSFHSFRRGGAYNASRNGVEDSSIKKYGRWKSSQYILYVHVDADRAADEVANAI
jgi:integrase